MHPLRQRRLPSQPAATSLSNVSHGSQLVDFDESSASSGYSLDAQEKDPLNELAADSRGMLRFWRSLQTLQLPLYSFKQVPKYLQDNEFILSGYRSGYSMLQVWVSLFRIHNETVSCAILTYVQW